MKKIRRILKWGALSILVVLVIWFLVAYWSSTNDCGKRATSPANPIKAIVYCDYGTPDVLRLEEIEKPVPNDQQLLVKVHAVSVNPYDWHFVRGTPYIMRMFGVG